jgi:hypothetical protein
LPGFDENLYAETSRAAKRSKSSLLKELAALQNATVEMFASFDAQQLEQVGVANEQAIYVKGLGFIIIGHSLHHLAILKERYLL